MKKRFLIFFLLFLLPLMSMDQASKNKKTRKEKSIFPQSILGKKIYANMEELGLVEKKQRKAISFIETLIDQTNVFQEGSDILRFKDYKLQFKTYRQEEDAIHTCTFSRATKMLKKAMAIICYFTQFAKENMQSTDYTISGIDWFIKQHSTELAKTFPGGTASASPLLNRYDMYIIQLYRLNLLIGHTLVNKDMVRGWLQTQQPDEKYSNDYVDRYMENQQNIKKLMEGLVIEDIKQVKQALSYDYSIQYNSLLDEMKSIIAYAQQTVPVHLTGKRTLIPPLNFNKLLPPEDSSTETNNEDSPPEGDTEGSPPDTNSSDD